MTTRENGGRWLILVHQLPARPSNIRVKIWRRLQQLGAVALRNSVYVLPNTAEAREDFEWLCTEIASVGGSATAMAANVVDSYSDQELVAQFREERRRDYQILMRDVEKVLKRWRSGERRVPRARTRREAQAFRERYARIRTMDYFSAENANRTADMIRELEVAASDAKPAAAGPTGRVTDTYRAKTWVTRTRPGIDRIASAWFIRRHVDSKARFSFVASTNGRVPSGRVPFDMYGVEFGHHGSHCTLETFIERFAIADPATVRLSQIVHDLDLKDDKYGLPECAAVGRLVDGLRQLYSGDDELLTQGIIVMEALYRSLAGEQSEERAGRLSGRSRRKRR
jgi:hypothetical protein